MAADSDVSLFYDYFKGQTPRLLVTLIMVCFIYFKEVNVIVSTVVCFLQPETEVFEITDFTTASEWER